MCVLRRYQAWVGSIETAKAGLQATLIIRHPEDGKLYVNFDHELLQLIRESKCMDRMSIEIPESAKIALLQVRACFCSVCVCVTRRIIGVLSFTLTGGQVQIVF